MAKEIEINVKATGIGALKAELRDLKSQLANATDPADMERLAKAAGTVSDQIKDVNEKIAVFAAGSEFEKVSNGLGLITGQLASMDFEGAAESAKLLTTTIKGMDPKAIADGFKGLVSTVGQLSKAFVQMGIKLLTNPLFLLIAVIGGIVAIIISFKDKIKILEQAFDLLMKPIDMIIQALKDLGDWLGLTSFAADEAADKHIKANEKMAKSYKDRSDAMELQFDREIRLAKISGQETENLEIEKQKSIKKYSKEQIDTYRDSIDTIKDKMSRSTREQKKELQEQLNDLRGKLKEQREVYSNSNFEITAIKAQAIADDKKKDEEAAKASAEAYKQRLKEKEEAQKLHVETLRKIKDIEISIMEDGLAKDKAIAEEAYKRSIEDLAKTKVTKEDKAKLEAAYLAQKQNALLKADTEEAARVKTKNDAIALIEQERIAKEDEQFLLLQETTLTKNELELAQLVAQYDAKFALANGNAELEKALQDKLNTEVAEINQKHRDEEAAKEKVLKDQKIQAVQDGFSTIGNLAELFAGKSRKAQENAFKVQKAAGIANATIDTYKAATGAYASLSAIPVYGPVLGGLAAAAAVTAGLINVKKIASQQFGAAPSGGAPAAPTAPNLSTPTQSREGSTPLTPSFNLFGKPNTANTATSTQSAVAGEQSMVVKAIVVESDVTSTQDKIAKIENSATL